MFIRYQFYKGYIELASIDMLYELEKDIKEDCKNEILDIDLSNKLLKLINNKRVNEFNISVI